MKIVSSCTCPLGEAAGHDADECRANLIEDGSKVCVVCGTRYPKMSDRMHGVWRSIVAAGFGIPYVSIGSDTVPGTSAYNASCLSGYDPALSDLVRARFRTRNGEKVSLEYELSNEPEIDNPTLTIGRELTQTELSTASPTLKACVKALESQGFRVRCVTDELEFRIVMSCGRPVGSMGYVIGVHVELSQPE